MRVGIIGANPERGWAARAHVPALKALPGFELVALSTSRDESARRAAEVFDVPHSFADATKLVRLPDVDLIVVTVKVSAHAELVQAAIAAGKDVYCEWPLALSIDEAIDLERAAQLAGVRTFIGLQARYSPAFAYARDLLRTGAIGRLTSATLYSSRAKGSTEAVPGWTSYTYDKSQGAGLVEVLGGHALDLLEQVAGPIATATGRTSIQHPHHLVAETGERINVTSPDHLDVIGELTNGAAFSVHLHDGEAGIPRTHLQLTGTEASLTIESVPDANPWSAQLQIADLAVRRNDQLLQIPEHYRGTTPALPLEPASVARLYQQIADHNAPDFSAGVRLHRLLAALSSSQQWTGQSGLDRSA
jgi:predicted dehydrogenase